MQLLIRKVASTVFPIGFTLTLETKTKLTTSIREFDGRRAMAVYDSKVAAIKAESDWYSREYLKRKQQAEAEAAEHGACLSHIPGKCGCGDCLTYLAGQ